MVEFGLELPKRCPIITYLIYETANIIHQMGSMNNVYIYLYSYLPSPQGHVFSARADGPRPHGSTGGPHAAGAPSPQAPRTAPGPKGRLGRESDWHGTFGLDYILPPGWIAQF